MAARGDASLLNQADSIWKMLDELAETDPEGYAKFMSQKMKESKEFSSPPEPCFCIGTSMLPEVIPHKVFVNICGWERMPAPKSDRDPIPVMVGELHTEGDPQFSVIDAVINPIALKGVDNNKDHKNLLAHVALDYIEAVKSIRLSRKYKTLKAKYKGDPKQLRRFLKAPASLSGKKRENAAGTSVPSDPSSLLQQLSTITVSDSNTDVGEPLPNLFQQNTQKPAKPGLIQEISSTPNEEMPPVPKHELHIRDADGTKPQRILLHVCLPGVTSAASCQLDISEEDVLLVVGPKKYRLHVQLPQKVDEDKSAASFNTLTQEMLIKLPTKQL